MDVGKLRHRLFELFPRPLLETNPDEWGIYIPAGFSTISKVGFATSLSPWVIEDARQHDVDFLVTHHDVWDFLFDMRGQCRQMLDSWGIGHVFVHAPLDACEFGTSVSLLESLGCPVVDRFCEESGMYFGRIGEFGSERHLCELEAAMTEQLGEKPRFTWDSGAKAKRVAIVSGGGYNTNYVREARQRGCDTFVTGEYSLYLGMFVRGERMNSLVYSHTATEKQGTENLAKRLLGSGIPILELDEGHL